MLRKFSSSLINPLCCALILGVCVLIARPFVDMGFNDDWCYIWSAQTLAHTGHVVYNGWGAMLLGWQLYLGALFIKLFGFSFVTIRIPIFVLSLLCAALMQRVIVRCGANEWDASVATLTVVLSPLFVPLAFSFMSDIPAFFCILVCFYACVRAMQSQDDRYALGWLAFAALSNLVGGTVRQIAWLGVLAVVPAVAWSMRHRRGALKLGLGLWAFSVVGIYACLKWFEAQPYTFKQPLIAKNMASLKNEIHCGMAMCFCALPILLAFLLKFPFRRRPRWTIALLAAPLLYASAVFLTTRDVRNWIAPFSNDAMTIRGIDVPNTLIGVRPNIMHAPVRIPLAILTLCALVAPLYFIGRRESLREVDPPARVGPRRLSDSELFWLLAPYTAAYILLVVTRESVFDRYYIPILFVFLTALTRLHERRVARRFPAVTVIALALFAMFSVAGTHDLYATLRARLNVANQLRAAGVPREGMFAGVEYDGWTQLQLSGHVNNPMVKNPPGAWHDLTYLLSPYSVCKPWWTIWFPDLHPKYELSYEPLPCRTMSQFGPYEYKTWLAPRTREIYVLNTEEPTSTKGH